MKRAQMALLGLALSSSLLAATSKTFDATYVATVAGIPSGTKAVTVWIPLPVSRDGQTVRDVRIDSPYKWTRYHDDMYGNDYAVASVENPPADLSVTVRFA